MKVFVSCSPDSSVCGEDIHRTRPGSSATRGSERCEKHKVLLEAWTFDTGVSLGFACRPDYKPNVEFVHFLMGGMHAGEGTNEHYRAKGKGPLWPEDQCR